MSSLIGAGLDPAPAAAAGVGDALGVAGDGDGVAAGGGLGVLPFPLVGGLGDGAAAAAGLGLAGDCGWAPMITTGLRIAVVSGSREDSGLLQRSDEQHRTFWYAQLLPLLFRDSQLAAGAKV